MVAGRIGLTRDVGQSEDGIQDRVWRAQLLLFLLEGGCDGAGAILTTSRLRFALLGGGAHVCPTRSHARRMSSDSKFENVSAPVEGPTINVRSIDHFEFKFSSFRILLRSIAALFVLGLLDQHSIGYKP
jgi:hypothetical protein